MAVNISSIQFRPYSLVASITRALKESGLDSTLLEIELTESAIMKNMEESSRSCANSNRWGCGSPSTIRDGYSSWLSKRFPLDILKIDRSFIRDIPGDGDNEAIAAAIIAMAHSLNLRSLRKGWRSENELAFVREHGCDAVQGYFYSPALPGEEIKEFLKTNLELMAGAARFAMPQGEVICRR